MKMKYKSIEKSYHDEYTRYLYQIDCLHENERYKIYVDTFVQSQVQSIPMYGSIGGLSTKDEN